MANNRQVGAHYERLAADLLRKKGYRIRAMNYRSGRFGEIDIIAQKRELIVFAEVKYRSNLLTGEGKEAVTFSKRRTICRVADAYLWENHFPTDTACRFDVIAFCGSEVEHLENAFSYIPAYS